MQRSPLQHNPHTEQSRGGKTGDVKITLAELTTACYVTVSTPKALRSGSGRLCDSTESCNAIEQSRYIGLVFLLGSTIVHFSFGVALNLPLMLQLGLLSVKILFFDVCVSIDKPRPR